MNLVVFDIDGTLIKYHKKRNDQAYVRTVKETFGIRIEDSWSDYTHSTDSGILGEIIEKKLSRPCEIHDEQEFKKSMMVWLDKEYGQEPFESTLGAKECLIKISNTSNWTAAIATGNWAFSGGYKLQSAGFNFKSIPFASADDGITRESILKAGRTKAEWALPTRQFEKIVYVGDWIWDVKAAQTLGWGFIGIASGEEERAIREAGAKHILPDFSELTELLKKI
jgi:phosphoglycolate phosphatase-like HAD superfamily hydrolase